MEEKFFIGYDLEDISHIEALYHVPDKGLCYLLVFKGPYVSRIIFQEEADRLVGLGVEVRYLTYKV
jgi:hypothetical protein